MQKVTVYIDESGTLPDLKDKVIVVAAVGTVAAEKIDLFFKQICKRAAFKKKRVEIKFYNSGQKTKTLFFKFLLKENFTLCVLVIDKLGRKIADTPINYAALCVLLIQDIANFVRIDHLVFDRHFTRKNDIDSFNLIITKFVGSEVKITHVDSKDNKRVNVADMLAGAVLAKESGKDPKFYQMIAKKIISFKIVNWKEVKRYFIAKKLA